MSVLGMWWPRDPYHVLHPCFWWVVAPVPSPPMGSTSLLQSRLLQVHAGSTERQPGSFSQPCLRAVVTTPVTSYLPDGGRASGN